MLCIPSNQNDISMTMSFILSKHLAFELAAILTHESCLYNPFDDPCGIKDHNILTLEKSIAGSCHLIVIICLNAALSSGEVFNGCKSNHLSER
jgi:hypothetical protein